MTSRKLFSLAFTISLIFISGVSYSEQCITNNLTTPQVSRQDWINPKIETDYYLLALSWSPQHCYNKRKSRQHKFQCKLNKFGFVVHGLWPQSAQARNKRGHPRFCNATRLLSKDLIRQYICIVPGVQLMQSQWDKHGNCAFQSASQYFATIATLWKTLKRPSTKAMKSRRYTVSSLKQLLVNMNTPKLQSSHIRIRINRANYLREIFICYDKNFQTTDCRSKPLKDQFIKIATPR